MMLPATRLRRPTPANKTTTTTYDALDRAATVENADGAITTYSYDNDGRLQVLTDSGV